MKIFKTITLALCASFAITAIAHAKIFGKSKIYSQKMCRMLKNIKKESAQALSQGYSWACQNKALVGLSAFAATGCISASALAYFGSKELRENIACSILLCIGFSAVLMDPFDGSY